MKHYYLKKAIILALALLPLWLYGQATFKPVLTDGRSWEVARLSEILNSTEEIDTVDYYTISVLGDTVVNNQTCKKIEIVSQNGQNESQTAVAYEENGKVWNVKDDGEMELLFDIGLHQYEEIGAGFVVEENHIYVNGVDRKRLYIDSGVDANTNNYENLYFYIVEGIGVSNNFWLGGQTGDIGPCVMLSCSENGETIFTSEDFTKPATNNEYVPLVREGVVWEYVGFRQNESSLPEKSLYTLEFNGTTTVDGKEYHNIYRTDYNEECIAQEPYLVACVREENKIVTVYINTDEANEYFYYTYWWWIPKTLYDFSKPMFLPDEASMAFGGEAPYDYSTDYSSIEVEVGETVRKGYYIDNGNDEDSFKTLEGIGVDCNFGDLLIPYRTYSTGFNPMSSLSAVYEDGELVYKGNAYDEAQGMKNPAAITTIAGERQEAGVRYYNLAGVESAEPQPGVNIRVTTYTDGTRKSEKIIR